MLGSQQRVEPISLSGLEARALPARLQRDAALQHFVERVRSLPSPPDLVVLYGSRARGDARPDSDYDLLIVLPNRKSPVVDTLYDIVMEIQLRYIRLFSLLLFSREEFERARARHEAVVRNALQEGYLLWKNPFYASGSEPSGIKPKSG
jgi:predicted nucleotidyltransferase